MQLVETGLIMTVVRVNQNSYLKEAKITLQFGNDSVRVCDAVRYQ